MSTVALSVNIRRKNSLQEKLSQHPNTNKLICFCHHLENKTVLCSKALPQALWHIKSEYLM